MNMVSSNTTSQNTESVLSDNIDPYALFEVLTGRKIDRESVSIKFDDYDDLHDLRDLRDLRDDDDKSQGHLKPDPRPHDSDVNVGCINPYALVETLVGRRMDRYSMASAQILSDVLQTDYNELFDMKHDSVLFAGLRLDDKQRLARLLSEKDVRILEERDLVTPDLSRVDKLEDLERMGFKDIRKARVKMARMQNGKLRLVVDAHALGRTVSNREFTMSLNELALPFRRKGGRFEPPNSSWRDMYEVFFQNSYRRMLEDVNSFRFGESGVCGYGTAHKFNDPVQGACPNSWLIAAIFSVFWADPCTINRSTRATMPHHGSGHNHRKSDSKSNKENNNKDKEKGKGKSGDDNDDNRDGRDARNRVLSIRLHDKGGRNNSKTATVEVNYEIPVNNSSNDPVYCRSSDGTEIWPALYEKAFAKWITGDRGEHPDITKTAHGDPIKAMAQINGREPHYFFCDNHGAHDLAGLVRANTVNHRTINPMCAFTHASSRGGSGSGSGGNGIYRGANLVANHAYSVLGWAGHDDCQYIILRNPWGVTEPIGLTSYPGLIDRVETEFWRPACLLDNQGVLAIEASSFKQYFACIGVAK